MSEKEIREVESSNFIHNIIDKDLETGKNGDKVYTRFPPEPNGYREFDTLKAEKQL